MMKFPIYGKVKFMFQTNNQPAHIFETMWGVFDIRGMGLILSTVNWVPDEFQQQQRL
jgi:hypothetical protein